MQPILECCCGVDVHKDMIEACIIKGVENSVLIREQFRTFPDDLQVFVAWLYENDCYHIAFVLEKRLLVCGFGPIKVG